jgi:hypothetical protein
MKLKAAVLFVAGVGFVLMGCQTTSIAVSPTSATVCNSHVCMVAISVDNCAVTATPDTIPIDKQSQHVEIHWDISTTNTTFAPNLQGIVINNNPPQFHQPKNPNPTKFIWSDDNTDANTYKYTVNVVQNGVACSPKDPFIANGR